MKKGTADEKWTDLVDDLIDVKIQDSSSKYQALANFQNVLNNNKNVISEDIYNEILAESEDMMSNNPEWDDILDIEKEFDDLITEEDGLPSIVID